VIRSLKILLVAMLSFATFSQLSCKLNDYCLECGKQDAGGSGSADAPPDTPGDTGDATTCVPTGDEICDGVDNDCDGLVDEGALPEVGDLCANQMGECAGGVKQCTPSFHCSVTTTTACRDASDTTSCPTGEICQADGKNTDHITCTKNPSPESCDGKDNNCNGMIDEGDPGDSMHAGGARCGNGTGTCVQGVYHCAGPCVNQADGCTGADTMMCQGGVGPVTEVCDGLDNDCDGIIDNNIPSLGSCGAPEPGCTTMSGGGGTPPTGTACGVCQFGSSTCQGGTIICSMAKNPTLEQCNGMDDDCDMKIDEDFTLTPVASPALPVYNKTTQNCGGCGVVCGAGLPNDGNAIWGCSAAGQCVITGCKAGFHDNNGMASDGCEFGVCFNSGPEICDGVDNDCDGVIDETPAIGSAPNICATQGECKNTVAACPCANTPDTNCTGAGCVTTCASQSGWVCNYPSTVTVDSNGNIVDETTCDGLDNDCNGFIDDAQPQMEHNDCPGYIVGNPASCPGTPVTCNNGQLGVCQRTGQFVCPASGQGAAVCNAADGMSSKTAESCNNTDDDCDGAVDEGASTGSLPGQTWVDIGGGHSMMKWEASRPDAAGNDVISTVTCSSETIVSASESGTTATYTTTVNHGLKPGDRVTVTGVSVAGYNATFLVVATPTTTTFTATLAAGLTAATGGFVQAHCPISITSATESGNLATFTTSAANGFQAGQAVIVSGMTNHCSTSTATTCATSVDCPTGQSCLGYNGTWVIQSVTSTTFTAQLGNSSLPASSGGTASTNGVATCSTNAVKPWTNITYPQALAACQAVGATLCTDQEWHRSCSQNASGGNLPTIYPKATDGTGLLLEAEDYYANTYMKDAGGTTRSWVEDETPGFLGISDLIAQPNTGGNISAANAPAQSPRLDYLINASNGGGTWNVCLHMFSAGFCSVTTTQSCSTTSTCPGGETCVSNDNGVYVGVNATVPGVVTGAAVTTTANNVWQWRSTTTAVPVVNGQQFLSLYMGQDGTKVDAIYLIKGTCPATPPDTHTTGNKWGMQPSAALSNYTSGNCNDQNYTGAGAGAALNTGSLAMCFADTTGLTSGGPAAQNVFDMSGNVREWTLAHQPGQNPIRGGAFNDTSLGIDCPGNFLLADDKFLLPNVGFRCCK
jgi:hypothetical protein